MQLQRYVGVFRGVFAGAFNRYLLKTDTFRTLARNIVITY